MIQQSLRCKQKSIFLELHAAKQLISIEYISLPIRREPPPVRSGIAGPALRRLRLAAPH
jgi:hypothetical protein